MTPDSCDVFVSGGGVAGLIAVACFARAGFCVICADPTPPVTARDDAGADLRTTAFLQPSQTLLQEYGLWDRLAPHAAELQIMRIVDAGGPEPEPRITKDFNATDISDKPFGWNLPNWLLRREFLAALNDMDNATFLPGLAVKHVFTREAQAKVTLSDESKITARLVVAADGRDSTVRRTTGIDLKTTRYGQKALAFAVTHPTPHDNISTEIHRSGGPFTLVPLPDHEGRPCSAIVWMERGQEVDRLSTLPVEKFEAEMNARSCLLFGPLKLETRRSVWPIISQLAERMSGERVALMAEAAHVVPPIGAQGLNMSLGDLAVLLELAGKNPEDLGDRPMLDTYHNRRHLEVKARVAGVDMLNRASMLEAQPLRDLRAKGLDAIYSLAPIRKTMMQLGLGAKG